MGVRILLFDGDGLLGSLRDEFDAHVAGAVALFEARAALDADLLLVATDIYDDPRWFSGGIAYSATCAHLPFNPTHPRFGAEWRDTLAGTVVHELHHCLRWPHRGRAWTLGEIAVLEGLAMLAENEVRSTDHTDAPRDACARLLRERDVVESDETVWFRAVDDDEPDAMPLNYRIGRTMMRHALPALGLDPFEAAREPAATLLDAAARTMKLDPSP